MFDTLQKMKLSIITIFGTSDFTYGRDTLDITVREISRVN